MRQTNKSVVLTYRIALTLFLSFFLLGCPSVRSQSESAKSKDFIVQPYLQLGDAPLVEPADQRVLHWRTSALQPDLKAEFRRVSSSSDRVPSLWKPASIYWKAVRIDPVPPYFAGSATLYGLKLNAEYDYRLTREEGGTRRIVFNGWFQTRKTADRRFGFAVMGDCGSGKPGAKRLASVLGKQNFDLLLVPGDIVYDTGRDRDYLPNFYDVYNADAINPEVGAPLMRDKLFFAVAGNHDVGGSDFTKGGDGLAYYYDWDQPLNGPDLPSDSPWVPKPIKATDAQFHAFLRASGAAYPRMGNFSFDDGDIHFTLIDSNPYVDWSAPSLQDWLRKDLAGTKADWKIVLFHHPPFDSSSEHYGDQQMRVLAPLFEKAGVQVVFCGHEHNYQRAKPLRFKPDLDPATGKIKRDERKIAGQFAFDERYDGIKRTKPNGVLYLTSGGGGQTLYHTLDKLKPVEDPYKVTGYHEKHSFTLVKADSKTLEMTQIDEDGKTVDHFFVSR